MTRQSGVNRASLMRDLLLDYPFQPAPNAPPVPEGLSPEEEAAFFDDFEMRNPEVSLEGNYPVGENGQPAAQMVPAMPLEDVQGMQEYLQGIMPSDPVAPVPEGEASGRQQALMRALMQRG